MIHLFHLPLQKRFFQIILGVTIGGFLLVSALWIARDTSPPIWDIAGHQVRTVIFGNLVLPPHPFTWITRPSLYPPATYSFTGVLGVLTNFPEDLPQYTLLVFALVTALAIYGLAKELTKDRRVGLIAITLFSCSPLVAHFSRIYDLDFPLTATVTVALYAFVKSRALHSTRWTILSALAISFGMLTKWTFFIYWLPPAIVIFWQQLQQYGRPPKRQLIQNLCLLIGGTAVLCVPWYIYHARAIAIVAVATVGNGFSVPVANLLSLDNFLYYARKIILGMTWPLAFVAGLGFILAIAKRQKKMLAPVLWVCAPYVALTFFLSKETRYFLPSYPALALLGASALVAIPYTLLRRSVIGITVLIALLVWIETGWNIRLFPTQVYEKAQLSQSYGYNPSPVYGYVYPTQYDTHLDEVAAAIKARWTSARQPKIVVVPNSMFVSFSILSYQTQRLGLQADYALSSAIRSDRYPDILPQADFIVTKTGDQGPAVWAPFLPEIQARLQDPADAITQQFTLVQNWTGKTFELGSPEIRLYQKTVSPSTE